MGTPRAVEIPIFLQDFTIFGIKQGPRLLWIRTVVTVPIGEVSRNIMDLRSAVIAIKGAVRVGMYCIHVLVEDDSFIDTFQGSMKRVTGKK
ncbi:unnamed protein product [Alternaria alternata]